MVLDAGLDVGEHLRLEAHAASSREPVDLGRHHEVVARQPRGRVRREVEARPAPAQLDVGVVPLGLGHQRRARDEPERVAEVRERELAAQLLVALALPLGHLRADIVAASSSDSGGVPFSQASQCSDASVLTGAKIALPVRVAADDG